MTRLATRGPKLAALALASTLVLAACGGAQPGGDAAPQRAVEGHPRTNAWVLTGGGWPVIEQSFQTWNEAHADQSIAVESFANDAYKEKIRTSVGSGQSPTLIMNWTGGTLADYVRPTIASSTSPQAPKISFLASSRRWPRTVSSTARPTPYR